MFRILLVGVSHIASCLVEWKHSPCEQPERVRDPRGGPGFRVCLVEKIPDPMKDYEESHQSTYACGKVPKLLLVYAKSRSEHRRRHRAGSRHGGDSL